jgi:hypothetical protein
VTLASSSARLRSGACRAGTGAAWPGSLATWPGSAAIRLGSGTTCPGSPDSAGIAAGSCSVMTDVPSLSPVMRSYVPDRPA